MPAAIPGSKALALSGRARLACLALLALTPLLLAALATFTDIDLRLADAAYDPLIGDFPWRHAWLADTFSHVLLKRALVGLAVAFIVVAGWDALRPLPMRPLRRAQLRVVAWSAVLVPAIVSLLKQASSSHCPWDIDRYGGMAPYVRLFETLPAGVDAGHCMPGGHASSALWLVSLAVLFLPSRPRAAAATFVLMLAFGGAVGWLQQLRGAHFLSHTLWSAWIACAVLYVFLQRAEV